MKKLSEIAAEINSIQSVELRKCRLEVLNRWLGTNFIIFNDRVSFSFADRAHDLLDMLEILGL